MFQNFRIAYIQKWNFVIMVFVLKYKTWFGGNTFKYVVTACYVDMKICRNVTCLIWFGAGGGNYKQRVYVIIFLQEDKLFGATIC